MIIKLPSLERVLPVKLGRVTSTLASRGATDPCRRPTSEFFAIADELVEKQLRGEPVGDVARMVAKALVDRAIAEQDARRRAAILRLVLDTPSLGWRWLCPSRPCS